MDRRSLKVLMGLLLLGGAAGAVLVAEARAQRRPGHAEEFQRLVGGLGFGPALDLSGCAFGFDPRLDGACAEDRGPLPGGACFCPRHAGSLFFYPGLERRGQPELFPVLSPDRPPGPTGRDP